jgi:SAM-dependent methyltransferase
MAEDGVARVLDVGCNRGQIELLFHQLHPDVAKRRRIDGVDISRDSIQQAQTLGLPECSFQAYDGITLPFDAGTFDLVVLVEVIEHVSDKPSLLAEIARVLRRGGRLFLTTPNPDCTSLRTEFAMWRILRKIFRRRQWHKDEFVSHQALIELLKDAGFALDRDEQLYAWPHLFIFFLGWSLLPPLPPGALFQYQKLCVRLLEERRLPKWIAKRCMWSLIALVRRGS